MIYFHGIGEDLGDLHVEMNSISNDCKLNLLAVEYPGFGIHWDKGLCTETVMIEDGKTVLKFVIEQLRYDERDLIIFGRSMGTGVATTFVQNMQVEPALLVLVSPFLSLNKLIRDKVGCLANIFKSRFDN